MIIVKERSGFSLLAEEIVKSHRGKMGEYVGVQIEGKKRIGKSVYATKVMRDVFMLLNPKLQKTQAYEMAGKHLHFRLEPFLRLIMEKQQQIQSNLPNIDWTQRIPVLGLDDASLYVGKDLYFRNSNLYNAFENTMTTIGTTLCSLVITTPSHKALAKCLRDYYEYLVVKITVAPGRYGRLATIKEWYTTKYGTLKLRKIAEEEFTAHIPNEIYAPYLDKRMSVGMEAVGELLTAVEAGKVKKDVAKDIIKDMPREMAEEKT